MSQEKIFATAGFLITFILVLATREIIITMIKSGGFTRSNFKNIEIPLSAGVIFFISSLPAFFLIFLFTGPELHGMLLLFLFATGGATLLGLVDDFLGTRETTGLTGHFKALFAGKLTTGAVKALGGGTLALIAATYLYPGQLIRIMDSALIIALSVNLLNLFDLRPGRAGKVYIILVLAILPFLAGNEMLIPVAIITGALVAYLPADLKARAMMGDAGSNTLGVVIGVSAAAALDGYYRAGYLAFLLIMHIITEKYSLTRIISGNSLLNYLDMLGRDKEPGN